MFLKKSLITHLTFSLVMFTISTCGIPKPVRTPAITVEPTITQEPTSATTSTPEVARPSVPDGLRPKNAAAQTLENGAWVVKNVDGQVTASWNSQENEWTYNMEAIIVQHDIAGYMDNNPSLYEEILNKPIPPDDSSMHFIDPDTGKPMEYGTWKEGLNSIFSTEYGELELPVKYICVQIRGMVEIDGIQVMLYSTPQGIDGDHVVAIAVPPKTGLPGIGVSNHDLIDIHSAQESVELIPKDIRVDFVNNQLFGKQALILVRTKDPQNVELTYDAQRIYEQSEDIINFLNGNQKKPTIVYDSFTQQISVMPKILTPQEQTGPYKY